MGLMIALPIVTVALVTFTIASFILLSIQSCLLVIPSIILFSFLVVLCFIGISLHASFSFLSSYMNVGKGAIDRAASIQKYVFQWVKRLLMDVVHVICLACHDAWQDTAMFVRDNDD